MAHDVFISHSDKNKKIAAAICSMLEAMKIRCWIAPRDVGPGKYGEAILNAIRGSRIMVVVFSADSNISEHVSREVERAVHEKLIIIPFKIEDVQPSPEMEYFLATAHWLDALSSPMEASIQKLGKAVAGILNMPPDTPEPTPKPRKIWPIITAAAILLAGVCALLIYILSGRPSDGDISTSPPESAVIQSPAGASDTMSFASDTTSFASASSEQSAMAFEPKGLATITLTNGQKVITPANCLIYRSYSDCHIGLYQEEYSGRELLVPFEEISSFTFSKDPEGYTDDYVAAVNLSNGGTETVKVNGILVAVAQQGRIEAPLSEIMSVELDQSKSVDFDIELALVEPLDGTLFYVPACLIQIEINDLGMGVSTDWCSGLPLQSGNILSFDKIKSFQVLESSKSDDWEWAMEASLKIVLIDGQEFEDKIEEPTCYLDGVNTLGVFSQSFVRQLKSVTFDVSQ